MLLLHIMYVYYIVTIIPAAELSKYTLNESSGNIAWKKIEKNCCVHKFGDRMTRSRKSKGILALNLYHIYYYNIQRSGRRAYFCIYTLYSPTCTCILYIYWLYYQQIKNIYIGNAVNDEIERPR
jgi:hypothetical protein